MSHHTNDRDRTSHQVTKLRTLAERERRRRLLAHFASRRIRELLEPDGLRRTPFRLVRSLQTDNDEVPVVPEQVICRTRDFAAARTALIEGGYVVERASQIGNLVDLWQFNVRVPAGTGGPARAPSSDLRDIAALLRNVAGVEDASLNHVCAMAGRAKGGSTPEPTDVRVSSRPEVPQQRDPLVVVIDTGMDVRATPQSGNERRTDGWLDDVAVDTDGAHFDLLDTVDYDGNLGADGFLDLAAGHGTFVAGAIRRVAPGANITMLRALDTDGFCDERYLADMIVRANDLFRAEPDRRGILNLSLGFESVEGDKSPVAIEQAIGELPDNVLVVAAAGNGPTGIPVWPAASSDPRVLGVASVFDDGSGAPSPANLSASDWSNRGEWVDFSAIGEGVVSTFVIGCETPGRSDDDPYDDDPDAFSGTNPYATWTGTSFATAKVTGALVNAMAHDSSDVLSIADELRATGQQIPGFGAALPI